MNQSDVERWIAEQGGPDAVQYTTENQTIPNPDLPTDPIARATADPNTPKTITIQVQTWVNKKTGAGLSVKPSATPGQYDVIKQSGPAAPAATGPRQVQTVTYENRGGKSIKVTTYTDGTKSEEEAPPEKPPAASGGTIVEHPDGVYVVRPDGTSVKTNIPAKPQPGQSIQAKGDDGGVYVITVAPDGSVSTKLAIPPQSAGPPAPASASGWAPDLSQPDVGIGKRRADVAAMLAAGVFGDPLSKAAQDKALALLQGDYAVAKTTIDNVSAIQTGEGTIYSGNIRQRESDQRQADTRLASAESTFRTAFDDITKLAPYAKHGSTVVAALNATLAKAHEYAQQFGGLQDQPQVQPGSNMTRSSDLFKPQPLGPATTPAAAPGAAPAPAPTPGAAPFVPPPTGAPRTAPATQGSGAPTPPPVIQVPPPPTISPAAPGSSDYGPFDPPGYGPQPTPPPYVPPGQAPASTTPTDTGPWIPGPRPGDFPTTDPGPPTYYPGSQMPTYTPPGAGPINTNPRDLGASLSDQAARAQAMIGPPPAPTQGGTLAFAHELGFSPESIAAWVAMQQQPAA